MKARALSAQVLLWGAAASLFLGTSIMAASPVAAAGTPITQSPPTSESTTTVNSSSFTPSKIVAVGDGSAVSYTTTNSSADLSVDTGGNISIVGAPLHAGSYTVSGTDSDADTLTNGDSGNWTYTLTVNAVTIVQGTSSTGSVDVAGSASFNDTISATSGFVGAVTFDATSSPDGLSLTAGNEITSTGTGTLSAGSHTISGTDSDPYGDTGTWSYDLSVTAGTLTQTSPTTGTTTTALSSSFAPAPLSVTNNIGAVTFTQSGSSPGLSLTGDQISTTGTLAAGSYTISGTDSDANGDMGTWTYDLSVTAGTLTQTSPTTGVTTTGSSSSFVPGSLSVTNNIGAVTFIETSSSTGLSLTGNQISTIGTLAAGDYPISGTDSDANGDTGTWTYDLTVTAPTSSGAGGGAGGGAAGSAGGVAGVSTITQTSPNTGATTPSASSAFNPGTILVANNQGPVKFVTTTSSAALSVSANGVMSTTGPLIAGTYTVSGTDSDAVGDTGTWRYTLTVSSGGATVMFKAHGGVGTMSPESKTGPAALKANNFTRSGYAFVGWNTASDGSGVTYANGAIYSFGTSITIYAQWNKAKSPTHALRARTVFFNADGGRGTMAVVRSNGPAALSPNGFTRSGYAFTTWNTSPNGSGVSYANGAVYAFRSSTTLFAQWKLQKAVVHIFVVRFNAHGGRGTMAAQQAKKPAALTANGFNRPGYFFARWTTVPNGSGASYADGATYSFNASTTLYAQWRSRRIPPKPAVGATVTLGPFAVKSAVLSPTLDAQIVALAGEIKSNRDKNIVLVGYGDTLSATSELNESLWAANIALSQHRATAVESFLQQQLAKIGVTGYNVTASGNGAAVPSGTSSTTTLSNNGLVIATLT
jgi:outer membrane protein OmpA-like peptidoglycan-associated protein